MTKTLEELGGELQLDVEHIPVEAIIPDPDNPNYVDDETMDALEVDIRERGFVQPILVRREGEGYRMIDGEHRWTVVKGLGLSTIPAVITEDDGDDAKIRLLTMNRLRGQFVPIRLAYLLKDLAERIPEKELRRRLGMEESELRDSLRLANFTDDLGDRLRESAEKEEKEAPVAISFLLSQRDARVVERVLSASNDKGDRGKALLAICRAHEKATKEG